MRYASSIAITLALIFTATGVLCAASKTPFELYRGLIVVEAEVNGNAGYFIIDSGAPGLVLNRSRHNIRSSQDVELAGLSGSVDGSLVLTKSFKFAGFQLHGLNAMSIDLTYLEKAVGRNILGLIGTDLFSGYDVVIDYAQKMIDITDDSSTAFGSAPSVSLPLRMVDHIMVVEIAYTGRTLRFGIDTGSRCNFISAKAMNFIPEWKKIVRDSMEVIGADQRITQSYKVEILDLITADILKESAEFVVHTLNGFQAIPDLSLDGILGHEFFRGRTVVISKDRKTLAVSLMSETMRNTWASN